MEFPIRFPAPFLNPGPLPYIRSGPTPYISPYPAPYLHYSPSPYGNAPYASIDPPQYSSHPDASRGKSPYASSDSASSSNSSCNNISGNASYASSDSASSSNSSYNNISGNASYASSDPALFSSHPDTSRSKSRCASSDSASSSSSSCTSRGSASSGSSSYASDLAMDTSQELSLDEEEFPDGKDLILNDSGISCSDESDESGLSPDRSVRGSRKRKSFEPCRTLLQEDPNFRGVTVTMENKFVDSEWKLVMHSTFSLPPKKKRKFRAYVDSSDEEDINNNFTPITEEKHCASCSVKKTPLWRDAEDGTPLCNACGIRYKKYKLRCGTCWHIPKKDEFRPTCQYCGSFYEYIYPRR